VITSILLFILVVVSLFFILNAKSNEELEKSYLVLFESNGGSSVMSQRVIEGNNVKRPENPTKNGFTFLDWFLDDKEFDFDSYKVTKDITLKAKWNIIEGTEVVVVHFNSDGGTEIDDIELVIVGGESDRNARLLNFDWVLSIREQCIRKNVNFEFRQCGTYTVKDGKHYKIQTKDLCKQAKLANIDYKTI